MVSPRPLLLNEIAQALGISRASVSINTRMFISNGSMEVRAVPGDRRQYYAMREDVFVSRLPFLRQMFRRLGEVFRQAELAVEAGETLRSSGQGGLGAAESTDAWEGALRSADAPGLRVQRGLVFLGFVEAQLEEMETRFRSMQRERS